MARAQTLNRTLFKGGVVLSLDPKIGDHARADVLVEEARIVAVGMNLTVQNAEVIDVTGRLVLPGLVDTHRHVWQGAILAFTPQVTGAGYDPMVLNGIAETIASFPTARKSAVVRAALMCRNGPRRPARLPE